MFCTVKSRFYVAKIAEKISCIYNFKVIKMRKPPREMNSFGGLDISFYLSYTAERFIAPQRINLSS